MNERAAVALSATVVAKNEAGRIRSCLEALEFCDETVVVVDAASADDTFAVAERCGARCIRRVFRNMNDQKDFARASARGTWVLNVDADEVVSPQLAEEIQRVIRAPNGCVAFEIPFRNFLRNVWVRRSGYYPDRHIRLLARDRARWDVEVPVHDRLIVDGRVGVLSGHIDHHSFTSIAHFIEKSNRYADGFARDSFQKGRRVSAWSIGTHTIGRFLKAYLLKGGILEGSLGLVISGLQAFEVFQKYVRLWELGRFSSEPPDSFVSSGSALSESKPEGGGLGSTRTEVEVKGGAGDS